MGMITQQRNITYYNVKDYGAKCDGSTSDTTAIAALALTLYNAGGGTIFIPAGICRAHLPIYDKVHYKGAGKNATTVKLEDNANTDVFYGTVNGYTGVLVNLAAANNVGSAGGNYSWSVSELTIDGNMASQTAGPSYCMRVYGYHFDVHHVSMRNGYSGGWYNDWNGGGGLVGGPGVTATVDDIEAYVTDVHIHNNGGNGLVWAGPHDSNFKGLYVYRNNGLNIHIAPNATGIMMHNVHVWGAKTGMNAPGILVEAGYFTATGIEAEGTDTCCLVLLASTCTVEGSYLFGNGIYSMAALQIGQAAGQTPFPGQANQSGGVTTAVGVSHLRVSVNIFRTENTSGAILFNNDTGVNTIRATMHLSAGQAYGGTINNSTTYEFVVSGLTATGTVLTGGGKRLAINSQKAFTVTDQASDYFNVDTYDKRVEYPNNAIIRQYSDSYATRTLELSNGTVNPLQSTSATVVTSSSTINNSTVGIARIAPTSDVTAVVLQAGSRSGQLCWVVNESAFTAVFAASGTSNVADGVLSVIGPLTALQFVWDTSTSLWYRCGLPVILPWALYDGDMMAGTTGVLAANSVYLTLIKIDAPVTLGNIVVRFNGGGGGNYDVGCYNVATGNLVCHSGVLATATGVLTPTQSPVSNILPPGRYYLAFWIDNATDTVNKSAGNTGFGLVKIASSISGGLPSTVAGLGTLNNGNTRVSMIGKISGGWS